MTTHKPYFHAFLQREGYYLKWTKDFGGLYYLQDDNIPFDCLPKSFYFGERWAYLTPGIDVYFGGGWRGNKSDDWICYDVGTDMKRIIDWLHESDDLAQDTKFLWTKNPNFEIR